MEPEPTVLEEEIRQKYPLIGEDAVKAENLLPWPIKMHLNHCELARAY